MDVTLQSKTPTKPNPEWLNYAFSRAQLVYSDVSPHFASTRASTHAAGVLWQRVTWLAPAVMQSLKAPRRVKKASSCCQREEDEGSSSLELRLAHCLCLDPGAA